MKTAIAITLCIIAAQAVISASLPMMPMEYARQQQGGYRDICSELLQTEANLQDFPEDARHQAYLSACGKLLQMMEATVQQGWYGGWRQMEANVQQGNNGNSDWSGSNGNGGGNNGNSDWRGSNSNGGAPPRWKQMMEASLQQGNNGNTNWSGSNGNSGGNNGNSNWSGSNGNRAPPRWE